MLPVSSLSTAAYGLRDLLIQQIDELADVTHVRIGHPGDTIKELEDNDQNSLNLFFYDVNYDGYPVDGSSDNPFYLRLHCLITAVGHKTSEPESPVSSNPRDVSKGENELRLIGEVMRTLHEQPLLALSDVDGNQIASLQVVPHTMNLDNLNHIWSTQTDISYRLSVAYEIALAPVPLAYPAEASPLVGDPHMVVWGDVKREPGKERDGIISLQPQVEYLEVDTSIPNWVPHICYVETIAPSSQQLHYVFKVVGNLDTPLDVLIAGQNNGMTKMMWNVWSRKTDNKIAAWKENIADTQPPVDKELKDPPTSTDPFFPGRIDPDDIDSRRIFQVKLPDDVKAVDTKSWQAMLFAIHEWTHEQPSDSGNMVTTAIMSNSILFYGEQP
jgi:hypothetical protein